MKSHTMAYFTLEECTRSDTARRLKIDNTPSAGIVAHITESIEHLLNPLREAWSMHCAREHHDTPAIRVSSGYRCEALNRAVGGVPNSAHCTGYAFDLIPCNGRMADFRDFCRDFLADKAFDQLISEKESAPGVPSWMHVGYKGPGGKQRRQFLVL